MTMSQSAVTNLATEILLPQAQTEKARLDDLDKWLRWDPDKVKVPHGASEEHKALADLSETPWLSLVVTTVAQQLQMETIRSGDRSDTTALMLPWQRNRMVSRQRAIHRAALGYGYAYGMGLPGDNGAVIRGYSPRDLYCAYQDPVVDEYPEYGIWRRDGFVYVLDEIAKYTLIEGKPDSNGHQRFEYVTHEEHNVGVTPIVRYSNQIDLEGRTPGEVEPFIPLAKRINKTDYDRLLAQHFNSWKVRYATGLDGEIPDDQKNKIRMALRQDSILIGNGETQFGTLDETPLDGFIRAKENDVETLAAVSQTPAHALTGKMINLSADAIVEARSMLELKAGERKLGFGDSHCQLLRLAAHIEGREDDAADFTLRAEWADLESRSMNQAADALGKMAASLGIPVEMLWTKIPGVTGEEALMWQKYKKANPSPDEVLARSMETNFGGADG